MSNLKKLIRERKAKTGESHQTAHRFVTGAHRDASRGATEPTPDDRKVYAREDIARAAGTAPDSVVAIPGATHVEEAHISYERADAARAPKDQIRVVGREYVTMTAVILAGQRAWLFVGLVDALWGGPEPKDLDQLADWLKQDLRADAVAVRSFKGNVAEITAHWIAKSRTTNEAAVEEIMGIEQTKPPSTVKLTSPLAYDSGAFFDNDAVYDGASALRAPSSEEPAAFGPWSAHGTHQRPANLLQAALLMAGVPGDELKKWDCELLGLRRISEARVQIFAWLNSKRPTTPGKALSPSIWAISRSRYLASTVRRFGGSWLRTRSHSSAPDHSEPSGWRRRLEPRRNTAACSRRGSAAARGLGRRGWGARRP